MKNYAYIFFIFGCWLLPEKFSFCPKNNGFARVWGLQPMAGYVVKMFTFLSRRAVVCLQLKSKCPHVGSN